MTGTPTTQTVAQPSDKKPRTTPARLRIWTAATVVLAAALLTALTVTVADTQNGIHRVGSETAPQAQATSDLYFALSDLDTQNARSLLAIGDDSLNGDLLDSVQTEHERVTDIDADLRAGIAGTTDAATEQTFRTLLDDVALYDSMSGQAVALDEQSPDTKPGQPAEVALSYYSQATDLMHSKILPAAANLRDTFTTGLTASANTQHSAAITDSILSVSVGLAAILALLGFQILLKRRFGRTLSPLLAVATAITVVLLGAAVSMNIEQTNRLHAAVADHMDPYLAIQNARTVTYDATGDAIRYVVAPPYGYQRGLDTDAAELVAPTGGGLLSSGLGNTTPALATTIEADWPTVLKDARAAMSAVDTGDLTTALDDATGIARGQTAFDFYVLDLHVGQAAAVQQAAFENGMASASDGAAGWAGAPAAAMGVVIILILASVRPRLAEYR
jgi:hypothetical protein